MRFLTLARFRQCLRDGALFKTDDAKADAELRSNRLSLGFAASHNSQLRFECQLGEEDTRRLLDEIDALLSGREPSSFDIKGIVDAARPRNAQCRCGSGKKFKKCCLKEDRSLPLDVAKLTDGITHPRILFLAELAKVDAFAVRDPGFWAALGAALNSAGFDSKARSAWGRALEISPQAYEAIFGLAVQKSADGAPIEALKLLEQVPIGVPRRAVINGNILLSQSRYDEAIPLFEEAIREEPDFGLPYRNLLTCLQKTAHPLLDHWAERSIESFPDSPGMVASWCRVLYSLSRLEELADADWIDRLKRRPWDDAAFDERRNEPEEIAEAQLWRACGILLKEKTKEALERACRLLPAFKGLSTFCDPAKAVLIGAVLLGDAPAVEASWEFLCPSCKEADYFRSVDFFLAAAASSRHDWSQAVQKCEACLASHPQHVRALATYWWALDELGRTEEAIAVAERTRECADEVSEQDAFYLNFNIGLMCGKAGFHGKAQYYYEAQLKLQPDHPHAVENLAITHVLNGHAERANELLPRLEKAWADYIHREGEVPLSPEVTANLTGRKESMAKLIAFGQAKAGSASYSLDVKEFLASLNPHIGSDVTIRPMVVSFAELLNDLQQADAARRSESLAALESATRGDHSRIIVRLSQELPFWESMPTDARFSLIEGERRLNDATSLDYAPEIVCFAKAVEVCLKTFVFDRFASTCRVHMDFRKEVQLAMTDKFKQVHNFIRFVDRGQPIELGTMLHTLRLTTGKTAAELTLLESLRDFIRDTLSTPELLEAANLNSCEELVKLRNPAAHSISYSRQHATRARALAVSLLGLLGKIPNDIGGASPSFG